MTNGDWTMLLDLMGLILFSAVILLWWWFERSWRRGKFFSFLDEEIMHTRLGKLSIVRKMAKKQGDIVQARTIMARARLASDCDWLQYNDRTPEIIYFREADILWSRLNSGETSLEDAADRIAEIRHQLEERQKTQGL